MSKLLLEWFFVTMEILSECIFILAIVGACAAIYYAAEISRWLS